MTNSAASPSATAMSLDESIGVFLYTTVPFSPTVICILCVVPASVDKANSTAIIALPSAFGVTKRVPPCCATHSTSLYFSVFTTYPSAGFNSMVATDELSTPSVWPLARTLPSTEIVPSPVMLATRSNFFSLKDTSSIPFFMPSPTVNVLSAFSVMSALLNATLFTTYPAAGITLNVFGAA